MKNIKQITFNKRVIVFQSFVFTFVVSFLYYTLISFFDLDSFIKAVGTYSIFVNNDLLFSVGIISFFLFNIFIHELIHAFIFTLYCSNGYKSIKIGFIKEYMMPYAHCKEELKVKNYMKAILAPFIFMGLLPTIFSFLYNNFYLFIYGFLFTITAYGDFVIFISLLNKNKNHLVLDHPSEIGYTITEINENR